MGRDAEEEITFLKELVRKEKNPKLRDIFRAMLLPEKKYRHNEVAELLGVTERTICNWKNGITSVDMKS